ncbi:transcription factor bHLH111 isoform X2 [Telopea speciosissima]|uniref:transcription factor bHLH111 isoform X2 n=1 Tax=Telopea speciosissima TaxID=54955 RepID=UPI001CC7243E|nr:transcription factor bHLH111 isoform X2 [Telopea speciosissima]
MAEEGSEGSVATSSSTPNWWELHSHPLSSWNNTTSWHPTNPNSNSSCEEDISISPSFTNASNQSGISVDSSRQLVEPASSSELMGEPASDTHLWSQVLLSVRNSGELHTSQDVGDNCWDLTNSPTLNNMEKQFTGYHGSLMENQRLNNSSNLVSNWSIAPPDPEVERPITMPTCNISLNNSSMNQYSEPDFPQMKQNIPNSSSYLVEGNRGSSFFPCYGNDLKVENQQEIESSRASFQRPFNNNGVAGYQINNSSMGDNNNKYYYGISDAPLASTRNLLSFSGCLSKPLMDFQASKSSLKALNSPKSEKQGKDSSSQAKGNGRGTGITNDGKKKRTEDTSETLFKKPKHESSTTSSVKIQPPKVKLGDRITALQQIVSPFGKTDTASVLLEAIGYIKFLQEQVQLLSDPYMKSNANKDPWGNLERKDKGESKLDLKSRGLCLVPISCTPQVYHENTGSDYLTPAYRGCLYR